MGNGMNKVSTIKFPNNTKKKKKSTKNYDDFILGYWIQVLPGLYVGNYRDSKDHQQLEKYNITHIVAIHDSPRRLLAVSILTNCNHLFLFILSSFFFFCFH